MAVGRRQAAHRPLMSERDKSFTVSDRRHFTRDGRPREEEAAVSEEVRSAAGVTPESPPQTGSVPPATPSESTPPAEPSAPSASPGEAVTFSGFLLSLAAQAGALLSGEGLPEGLDRGEAVESARSIVSVLEMLKDKTEGRRTEEEEALLGELLFQLRMAYVERKRAGGA